MSAEDAWPDWQRVYSHGTLVIWPPDPVRHVVNELRRNYDPVSQDACDAHVTLTQPLVRQPTEDEWRRLRTIVDRFHRFRCDYGPVRSFLPAPVVWLEVQPSARILEIRRALHDTGLFNLELPHTEDFVPHLTVTEGRSGPEVNEELRVEIAAAAPRGSFTCADVAYIRPDEAFRFSVATRLALGMQPGSS